MELTNKNNKSKKTIDMPNMVYGKVPPQAKELEEAVLGALMLERMAFTTIVDILQPICFYVDSHQKIFKVIIDLDRKSSPIDILTVIEELKFQEILDVVGGPYAISKLTDKVVSGANIEAHARIIYQKWLQRLVIQHCGQLIKDAYEDSIDPFDLVDSMVKMNDAIAQKYVKEEASYESLVMRTVKNILEYDPNKMNGMPSGFVSLDKIIDFFINGLLYVIAARPSMGKTAYLIQLVENLTKSRYSNDGTGTIIKNKPVGIIELETHDEGFIQRQIGNKTKINTRAFKTGDVSEEDKGKIIEAAEELLDKGIVADFSPTSNSSEIRLKAKRWKAKHDIGILLIDYLQYIDADDQRIPRERQVATISKSLAGLAKELAIPVIAFAQLSREVYKRADKRPQMSDLRECLSIETSFIYCQENIQSNVLSQMNLLSLSKDGIMPMESNNIPKKSNNVFRLTLKTGRFIDCTANHNILTCEGYKPLKEITTQDVIAVAKNWDIKAEGFKEARFVGWMLGNGCMYGYNVPSFITFDEAVSEKFVKFIENKFGFSPKSHKHYQSAVYQWDITKDSVRVPGGNPVTIWLKGNDLWGRKAKDKYIPDCIMSKLDNKSVKELLGGLWETDGSITMGKKYSLSYSTTSYILGEQIIYLLARLGIIGYIDNGYLSKKATTKCFKIVISNSSDISIFRDQISLSGEKGRKLKKLFVSERQSYMNNKLSRRTTLQIASILNKTKEARIQTHGTRTLTIPLLQKYIHLDSISSYKWLVSDTFFWDGVDNIEELGVVKVFDRSVPKTNNYIVNGIIVHNSGHIEQDARCVIFLHRPEYYGEIQDAETGESLVGITEVIVAKNNEGNTGKTKLKMIKEYSCFEEIEEDGFYKPIKLPTKSGDFDAGFATAPDF